MSIKGRKIRSADIDSLRALLSGTKAKVLSPYDSGYEVSIHRWSRAAEKPAGVAVVPSAASHVAAAVKYALDNNLDVAVKGGGHSTAGASSTNGGLLIDLGGMKTVRVDKDKQILYVEGKPLSSVGGTVADTGVGGLTLGGGYGVLSGRRGLVTDNMVGATVVLSNGDIVHASETDNDALFWGLLGAGQNFGVVTEFELRAYPQNEVYQGTLVLPPAPGVISKIIATMNDLYHVPTPGQYSKTQGRLSLLLGLARPPEAQHKTMVLLIMAYDGSGEDCKQLLQPVLDLGPVVNTLQMGPYPAVNKQVPTVSGFRSSMKGAAFVLPIRYEFFMHMLRKFDTFMDAETDAAGSLVAWEVCDPTAVVTSEKGCFANRGYHLNSLIMPLWSETESDMTCRQFARDMSLEFKKELELHGQRTSEGSEGGASVKGRRGAVLLYGNYDQYNEISRDIFGDNYPALQQLKAKYDPTNMFNKLFPITPEDVVKL